MTPAAPPGPAPGPVTPPGDSGPRDPLAALDHDLARHFPAIAAYRSTRAFSASALHAALRPEIDRVLGTVVQESFRDRRPQLAPSRSAVRVTAWNVERGIELDGIVRILGEHPAIGASDVLLLTELDHGMARTANRAVARDLAAALGLEYAFAPCYLSLAKGSGLESRAAGENTLSLHGNALFSRWPLRDAHALALPNGIDKMRGNEKRLGCQKVVVATVEHPLGRFRAVSVHLDAHSSQRHRARQMALILDHLERLSPRLPVVIGGDWNTSTYDSSHSFYSVLGFAHRVLVGVRRVLREHHPHPHRRFERRLFDALDARGYRWRDLNAPGACTWHYATGDLALELNLGEWLPAWCFWWIRWALGGAGGGCSFKLDWLAGRDVEPHPGAPPAVHADANAPRRLSDHDPITVDLRLPGTSAP